MGNFSIESYFESIRLMAPEDIEIVPVISRFESAGIFKRIWIALEAIFKQGDINHITGDIHFIAPFLKKKKTILTIHDCGQLKIKSGWSQKVLKYFWFTLPCSQVHTITVNSEYTKKDLLSYVNVAPKKIKVIPIFVPEVFKKNPKSFNKEKPVIFQLGTAHNKNIKRTIEALEGVPCTLSILGKLSIEIIDLLKKKKIEYSNIDRAVSENELADLYYDCDLVTFISTFEGFGMPVIEANIIGRPVISGNIASLPYVAGNAACLVDPFDTHAMHDGYKRIISDDDYRNLLIKNGFENCKRFDKKMIADQYFELYRNLYFSNQQLVA